MVHTKKSPDFVVFLPIFVWEIFWLRIPDMKNNLKLKTFPIKCVFEQKVSGAAYLRKPLRQGPPRSSTLHPKLALILTSPVTFYILYSRLKMCFSKNWIFSTSPASKGLGSYLLSESSKPVTFIFNLYFLQRVERMQCNVCIRKMHFFKGNTLFNTLYNPPIHWNLIVLYYRTGTKDNFRKTACCIINHYPLAYHEHTYNPIRHKFLSNLS